MRINNHIATEEILAYLSKPLGTNQDYIIEQHLAQCEECVSSLSFLDAISVGFKKFGQYSQNIVNSNRSRHLEDKDIEQYLKNGCNEDDKKRVVFHLFGCVNCLEDLMSIYKIYNEMEQEQSLIVKSYILSKFILGHNFKIKNRRKTFLLKNEAGKLYFDSTKQDIALLEINKEFSFGFAFEGDKDIRLNVEKGYEKLELHDFTVEILQPSKTDSRVLIGIIAKCDNIEQAKVTVCAEEEKTEIVELNNKRAIINKDVLKAKNIRYIKVEKV